ncbi:MAG: AbrB/MazE/SpoVT family DNA-binding domain-containing protein [Nanoarchaeota archaeon]
MIIEASLKKQGDNLIVILPKKVANELKIKEHDKLIIEIIDKNLDNMEFVK